MSCLYVAIGDVFTLINYTSFVQWFAIGLSVAALLYFRRKLPDAHRPLKVSKFIVKPVKCKHSLILLHNKYLLTLVIDLHQLLHFYFLSLDTQPIVVSKRSVSKH